MSASVEERITFICSACTARLKVPARLAGVTGPCPKCGATITAPKPKPQPAEIAIAGPDPQPAPAQAPAAYPTGTAAPPATQPEVRVQTPVQPAQLPTSANGVDLTAATIPITPPSRESVSPQAYATQAPAQAPPEAGAPSRPQAPATTNYQSPAPTQAPTYPESAPSFSQPAQPQPQSLAQTAEYQGDAASIDAAAVVPPWLSMSPAAPAPEPPPAAAPAQQAPSDPTSVVPPGENRDPFSNPNFTQGQIYPRQPQPGSPTPSAPASFQSPAPATAEIPLYGTSSPEQGNQPNFHAGGGDTPQIRLEPVGETAAPFAPQYVPPLAEPPPSPAQFDPRPADPAQRVEATVVVPETVNSPPMPRTENFSPPTGGSPNPQPIPASISNPSAAPSISSGNESQAAANPFDPNINRAAPNPSYDSDQGGASSEAPNSFIPPTANRAPEIVGNFSNTDRPQNNFEPPQQTSPPTGPPSERPDTQQPQPNAYPHAQTPEVSPPSAHPSEESSAASLPNVPGFAPESGGSGTAQQPSSFSSPPPFATPGSDGGNLPQGNSYDPRGNRNGTGNGTGNGNSNGGMTGVGMPHAGASFGTAAPHDPSFTPGNFDPHSAAPAQTGFPGNLSQVPENAQSHPDLDSFVQAAARSEKEARESRKKRPYGMLLRVAIIVIGLSVALISVLFIDYKNDGINLLHKVPGFSSLSSKFSNIMAKGDVDNGLGSSEGDATQGKVNPGGTATTPLSGGPGQPPISDAALAESDATDNGADTIPLISDSLSSPAESNTLAPGGEVSAVDPVTDASATPATVTGGSPGTSTTPGAATGPRTAIPVGDPAGTTPVSPDAGVSGNGGIELQRPDQLGSTTPGNAGAAGGTIGSPGGNPNAGAAVPGTPGAPAEGGQPMTTIPPTPGGSALAPDNPTLQEGLGPRRDATPGATAEPRRALTDYLDAPTWQQRLPLIYQGAKLQTTIASYYASHPDQAITPYDLELFHIEEGSGNGKPYSIFFVTTPAVPQGFPAIVRRTPDGFKVDWECFVEFHDAHFVKFVESGEPGPQSFRVVFKRAEYWGPDRNEFTSLPDYLCYRIELPYTDSVDFYGFIPLNDPLAEELQKKVNWGLPPAAAIITVKREVFTHGQSHLRITDFVTDDWHREVP